MLDLLVIWGHSSDDSISNPQVWMHRACKHAGLSQHSPTLPAHQLVLLPSCEHPSLIIVLQEISHQLF